MTTLLVLWAILISSTSVMSYGIDLDSLVMDWTIKDLDHHHLSWSTADDSLYVYSAWKGREKTSFDWEGEDSWKEVEQDCLEREVQNNVTKCTIEILHRKGSNLSLRLCRKSKRVQNECRQFFINDDDDPRDEVLGFQDVMYTTELSSMSFIEAIPSSNSVELRNIRFPKAACEIVDQNDHQAHAQYTTVARSSDGKETCKPSPEFVENNLRQDTFYDASIDEICNRVTKTVDDLKPNTSYCIYLLYKVTYRGKTINGEVLYHGPIKTDEADPLIMMIVFISLSIILLIITVAVVKLFVEPKYYEFIKVPKSVGRSQAEEMKRQLDIQYAGMHPTPTLGDMEEYVDELGCKLDREKDFARQQDEDIRNVSVSSFGSQETLSLSDQKTPSLPPPYIHVGNRPISSGHSDLSSDSGYYTKKPDQT